MHQTKKIIEEASYWLMRLQEGHLSEQEQQQLILWQQQSPLHQKVWNNALKLQGDISDLPIDLVQPVFKKLQTKQYQYKKYFWLVGLFPLIFAIASLNQQQQWLADYRNGHQKPKQITLPDGGTVLLNAETAIDIDYNQHQRKIILRRGQIWIETHADTMQRPFIVYTQQGTAQALGTKYLVSIQSSQTTVAVKQGAVKVKPIHSLHTQIVDSQQQIQFDSVQIHAANSFVEEDASWSRGYLMVNDMPLIDFVQKLQVYQKGKIYIPDELEQIRISGTYPIDDMSKIFSMLENTYSLQFNSYIAGYIIKVSVKK